VTANVAVGSVTYPQAGMHFRHIPALISQHALYQFPVKVWEISAQPYQIIFCIQAIHIMIYVVPMVAAVKQPLVTNIMMHKQSESPSTPMLAVDAGQGSSAATDVRCSVYTGQEG